MQGAVYVAAAIGVAVAVGALAAHWRAARPCACHRQAPAMFAPRKPMLGLVPLLALAAAGGFVALSYEIFFFRTVSYATGSSRDRLRRNLERLPDRARLRRAAGRATIARP